MNIVFVYAHLDDETILSYGTIAKLRVCNNIKVMTLCGSSRDGKFGTAREESYVKILKELNVKFHRFPFQDLHLTKNDVKTCLDVICEKYQPDIVFTHSVHDLHFEHRLLAEEAMVKFRPNLNVKAFYTSVLPTYAWANSEFGLFIPNYFVDISEHIESKKNALTRYDMEFPIEGNDLRSVESIINFNRHYGLQMNTSYCEAFQCLWSKN